jgi:aminotransferase
MMNEPQKIDLQPQNKPQVADRVESLPPSGIRQFFELVTNRHDILSLGVGEPDFVTPWRIREAALYHINRGETSYTSNSGLLSLRGKISNYLDQRFSVKADPVSEILITVGVSEALDLALRAILNPDDEVIIWEPAYVAYSPLVMLAGGRAVPLGSSGEDGFRFNLNNLKNLLTPKTRAIVLNYPNNPTGVTLNKQELTDLATLCSDRGIIMISDEIYAEMTHHGRHVSLASLPEASGWVLLLSGFSKSFAMTGWRIGYAAGPPELISAMTRIHQYTMLCASVMSQRAAEIALTEGLADMVEMCEIFRQRANIIVKALNEIGVPCHQPEGAFYAFPSIRDTGLESMEFCRRLLDEEKVAIVPGGIFGKSGEGHVRLAYAADTDTIETAIERLGRFIGKL